MPQHVRVTCRSVTYLYHLYTSILRTNDAYIIYPISIWIINTQFHYQQNERYLCLSRSKNTFCRRPEDTLTQPQQQQRMMSENGFRSTVPGNALHTSSCPGRGRVEWNRSSMHVFFFKRYHFLYFIL